MFKKLILGATALTLFGLLAAPIRAQDSREEKTVPQPEARAEQKADERTAREQIRDRIRRAIRLPEVVQDSRDAGVPEEKVKEVLDSARKRDVPADEVGGILEIENEAIRQGGNPDNFGAAVQQMKASGLRGRELAEAIHAEQYARGMKKPKKDKGHRGRESKDRDHDYDDVEHDDIEGDHEEIHDEDDGDERRRDARGEEKVKGKGKPDGKHDKDKRSKP